SGERRLARQGEDVLGPPGQVRAGRRREHRAPRAARRERFRVRVPDGQHEPQARSRDRDALHDDRRGLLLHLQPFCPGRGPAGRRCERSGAAERPQSPEEGVQVTSRPLDAVKPPATMAMTARAIQLRREGRDIVSLSVGEPDFPVFPHVEQAVSEALRKGYTKYTASNGILELREAISDWTNRAVGVRWPAAQIVATSGAKQALYNACMALLDEGDEAVIPNPYWVRYPEMVRLAGARPVELMLRAPDGWSPAPDDWEGVLSPRTRVVMFSTPSNPTG